MLEPPYDTNGSGSPVTGMMPRVIPMFSKAWKANQATTPVATSRPNRSDGAERRSAGPPEHHPEQQEISRGADEAELLPRDREDEVGLLLGDEAALGLRAVEQALAGQPAGADRDARLLGVVADAARVERRVGEGGEAGRSGTARACRPATATTPTERRPPASRPSDQRRRRAGRRRACRGR